jgi:glycosyltransferase involved in cell wall biosynthesis
MTALGKTPTEDAKSTPLAWLLAISFYYPPILEPRAIQVHRLLSHLQEPVSLVCSQTPHLIQGQATVASPSQGQVSCQRVLYAPGLLRRKLMAYSYRLRLPLLFRAPDRHASWRRPALRTALEILGARQRKPRAIISFGHPWSSLLVGLDLKRQTGLPWIAHMSDPWVNDPDYDLDPWTSRLHRHWESLVMRECTRILFPVRETAARVLENHPQEYWSKVRILPHAYDATLYPEPVASGDGKKLLRYLGSMYGSRSPEPLLRALGLLLSERPELAGRLRVEIVGDHEPEHVQALAGAGLPQDMVSFQPIVDYQTSLRLMRESDALLLIDAPGPGCIFHAKLADYLGARRPVLGIAPPGASADIILRYGGQVADPGDIRAIAEMLASFLERGQAVNAQDPLFRQEFSAPRVARKFMDILQEVGEG